MKLFRSILPFLLLSFVAQAQAPIKDGAILAAFSVSDSTKVYFSQGNLQYQASTGTWRFAEHQWDFVGDSVKGNVYEKGIKSNNAKISSTYDGWIDLFGWGTSGYNDMYPYMSSWVDKYYLQYKNKTIAGTKYDWGYNKISNGGNQVSQWRTLTDEEWFYLAWKRPNASLKYGFAIVNGIEGLVLLPDNWKLPNGISFKNFVKLIYPKMNTYSENIYSYSDWSKMEKNGAVFFPAAGFRDNWYSHNYPEFNHLLDLPDNLPVNIYGVKSVGDYWSSDVSFKSESFGKYMYFYPEKRFDTECLLYRNTGMSVRLVQDVK